MAFSLFGSLARFGSSEAYSEQIHSNIVSLLLHLNDEVEEVRTVNAFENLPKSIGNQTGKLSGTFLGVRLRVVLYRSTNASDDDGRIFKKIFT